MRNKIIIMALLSFFFSSKIIADGPPIQNGQISVPYITIKLSDEQVKQAGVYRYIELSKPQKAQLKKIAQAEVPNLLEIITAPYNDCACGLLFYGLWAKSNEVQVPKDNLEYCKDKEYSEYLDTTKSIAEFKKRMDLRELNIDLSGNVYQKGMIVNNLNKAYSAIEANKEDKESKVYIWVNTPPLLNAKIIKKTKTTFTNIKQFFSDKNYEVYAHFENEYIKNELRGYNKLSAFSAEPTEVDVSIFANGRPASSGIKWNIKASSYATWESTEYSVSNLTDSSLQTAWIEGVPGNGIDEKITFSGFTNGTGKPVKINCFIVANGFQKSKEIFLKNPRVKSLVMSLNGEPKFVLNLLDKTGCQKLVFSGITLMPKDELSLCIIDVYGGIKYQDTGMSLLIPCYENKK